MRPKLPVNAYAERRVLALLEAEPKRLRTMARLIWEVYGEKPPGSAASVINAAIRDLRRKGYPVRCEFERGFYLDPNPPIQIPNETPEQRQLAHALGAGFKWTPESAEELRRLAPDHTAVELADIFGTSTQRVRTKLTRLGAKAKPMPRGRAYGTPANNGRKPNSRVFIRKILTAAQVDYEAEGASAMNRYGVSSVGRGGFR